MIQGKNYIYLEIPRCGSTYVGDILMEQCGGVRLTPRHDPLYEVPEGFTVFTTIRKPFKRMASLYNYYTEAKEGNLIEWYEWMKNKNDDPFHVTRPYSFWTSNCDKVLKIEKIDAQLPKLMKELKFDIEMPEAPTPETDYNMSPEEGDYIKNECKEDFNKFGYSLDRRKNT